MGANSLIYTVNVETARVYKVRSIQPRKTDWANATVRSWPGGGSIDIQSDYGSYAHSWTAIGERSFLSFLCGLDYDYFMTKARGRYRQFDAATTISRIKGYIIDARRQAYLTKDEARELFNEADGYDAGWHSSIDALASEFSSGMCDFLGPDIPVMTRDNPETRGFWDRIWPMLVNTWREERWKPIEAEAA